MDHERIEHIFQFMEWDHLTDRQLEMIVSYERQYKAHNYLTDRQVYVLEDIFKSAAEKVEWHRPRFRK